MKEVYSFANDWLDKAPVTLVFTTFNQIMSHSAVRLQEMPKFFTVWCCSILTATKAWPQSSYGVLLHSYGVLVVIVCALKALLLLALHFHCADSMLKITYKRGREAVTSQENTVQSQCIWQPQRSHCNVCAVLRSFCGVVTDLTAVLWWPYSNLTAVSSEHWVTAFVLCIARHCAIPPHLLEMHCYTYSVET